VKLVTGHELLDDDEGTPAEIAQSFEDLWWINHHLGGLSTWRKLLARYLAVRPATALTLVDIGSGSGQVAQSNLAWLASRGVAATGFALDRRASHLGQPVTGAARQAIAADAFRLPFADASVDLVTCNLFLHHFHDTAGQPAATALLREMIRVARQGVLINDLDRAWLPYLAIHVMGWGLGFSRITRYDGPRSVRQAYTRRELAALAQRAGAANFECHWYMPFRLGLIVYV
jgi:SAM-dependent methyltransferase